MQSVLGGILFAIVCVMYVAAVVALHPRRLCGSDSPADGCPKVQPRGLHTSEL